MHGKKKNNRISLLFIGQGGVGKTSLKKSLLGKVSKKKEPSTVGIEFDVVEVQENNKSKPWKRAKDDQFIASKIYADNVLGKEVARTIAQSKDEPEEGRGGSVAGDEDDGVELEGESRDASGTKNAGEEGANNEVGQEDKDKVRAGDGATDRAGAEARGGDGDAARTGAAAGDKDGDDCHSNEKRSRTDEQGKSDKQKNMKDQVDYDISDDLKRKIEQEKKNIESYRDDTMDTIRFMLGDVGGQSVFYDVHSIMLRLRTLFILVVDLSMSLDDEAQPKFVDKGLTKKKRDQGNPLHETNFDYVTRWMAALRNLNPCSEEAENNSTLCVNLPKAILVFTKPDKLKNSEKLEQKLKNVTEALDRRFESIGCGSVIVAKYVIKNKKPRNADETSELKALRTQIFETAQGILKAQEETPISWLMLERALDTLRRTEVLKDCPYIALNEARKLGQQCQVNETFDEAMTFFHEENIVVHFDGNPPMSDLVVLDPSWLVKLFTQVLTVAPKRCWGTANSRAWKKLTTEGVLDFGNLPNPLENHSQEKALKDIMVRVGLICHWGKNIYLVPSMVAKRWEESDIKKALASSFQPSLYLNFEGDTIPLGLYTRVLVEILKWARGDVEHDDAKMPEFHCNCCRVFKCENNIKYSVILIRHVTRIQVAISGVNV